MTSADLRAMHILVDTGSDRLFAVFDKGANLSRLQSVASALTAATGVQTKAIKARMNQEVVRTPVIYMQFGIGDDRQLAAEKLKEMTNPQLPIAIGALRVELLLCTCKYLSTRLADMQFVVGFSPEDDESFMLRYYAGMKRMPVAELFGSSPHPPYEHLMDAIVGMLKDAQAYATELIIQPRPDQRGCTHA